MWLEPLPWWITNRRAARFVILQSALSEGTQFPVFRVRLNLVVPNLGVELSEPVAEGLQLVMAEAFHLSLYVLDSAHLRLHSRIHRPVPRAHQKHGDFGQLIRHQAHHAI